MQRMESHVRLGIGSRSFPVVVVGDPKMLVFRESANLTFVRSFRVRVNLLFKVNTGTEPM